MFRPAGRRQTASRSSDNGGSSGRTATPLTSIRSATPMIPGATTEPAATARTIASGLLIRSGSTMT